jgi:hypothetical protein
MGVVGVACEFVEDAQGKRATNPPSSEARYGNVQNVKCGESTPKWNKYRHVGIAKSKGTR